jgi:type II secretory pathway component PulF
MATFAEVLSLLIEQEVPSHEAIVLAADATGDAGLGQAAREISERAQRGEAIDRHGAAARRIPPLLGWLIATGTGRTNFGKTLRMAAETYREQAMRAVNWRAVYMPILLTAVFAGSVTLLQALATFGPLCRLLHQLGQP